MRRKLPVLWIVDCLDECRAKRLRTRFGRRQWLVSWEHEVGAEGDRRGRWRARLSCAALLFTLERTGRTRTEAIGRTARALGRLLLLRRQLYQERRDGSQSPPPADARES